MQPAIHKIMSAFIRSWVSGLLFYTKKTSRPEKSDKEVWVQNACCFALKLLFVSLSGLSLKDALLSLLFYLLRVRMTT